jgi:hypothetical protein
MLHPWGCNLPLKGLRAIHTEYHAASNYLTVSMPSLAMRNEHPGSTSIY